MQRLDIQNFKVKIQNLKLEDLRKHVPFIVALTLATLSSVAAYQLLNGRGNVPVATADTTAPVVVMKHDLAMGMKLTEDDLTVEYWTKENAGEKFFNSLKPLIGRILRTSVIAKEPVTASKLMEEGENISTLIPPHMRGVTITIPRSKTMTQMLERGSIVDVLVMFDNGRGSPTTKVVAQAARVLSVYDRQDPTIATDKTTKFMEVTLLVSSRDAEWLLIAANRGTMQLVLRNERARTS